MSNQSMNSLKGAAFSLSLSDLSRRHGDNVTIHIDFDSMCVNLFSETNVQPLPYSEGVIRIDDPAVTRFIRLAKPTGYITVEPVYPCTSSNLPTGNSYELDARSFQANSTFRYEPGNSKGSFRDLYKPRTKRMFEARTEDKQMSLVNSVLTHFVEDKEQSQSSTEPVTPMKLLIDAGHVNREHNAEALVASNGDVNQAIQLLDDQSGISSDITNDIISTNEVEAQAAILSIIESAKEEQPQEQQQEQAPAIETQISTSTEAKASTPKCDDIDEEQSAKRHALDIVSKYGGIDALAKAHIDNFRIVQPDMSRIQTRDKGLYNEIKERVKALRPANSSDKQSMSSDSSAGSKKSKGGKKNEVTPPVARDKKDQKPSFITRFRADNPQFRDANLSSLTSEFHRLGLAPSEIGDVVVAGMLQTLYDRETQQKQTTS